MTRNDRGRSEKRRTRIGTYLISPLGLVTGLIAMRTTQPSVMIEIRVNYILKWGIVLVKLDRFELYKIHSKINRYLDQHAGQHHLFFL